MSATEPAGPVRIDVAAAVTPTGVVSPASVLVSAAGLVVAVDEPARVGRPDRCTVLDRADTTAVPGFVDLQINGAAGHDFRHASAEGASDALAQLLATGVTTCCPTIVTSDAEGYGGALAAVAAAAGAGGGSRVAGVHLEGPFLAPAARGAHDARRMLDPVAGRAWAESLVASAPVPVAIWTLAPEVPGALDLIRALVGAGVVVSGGHTAATFDEVEAAVAAGLSMLTHLGNAMRGLHHREPGVVGAALVLDGLRAGVILDGIHVHQRLAHALCDALGDRAFAVTDATFTLGLPPGLHPVDGLGGAVVDTSSGAPRLPDGTLAGASMPMDEVFGGIARARGLARATALCSTLPAAALGLSDRGSLAPGQLADLALLDAGHRCVEVLLAGAPV